MNTSTPHPLVAPVQALANQAHELAVGAGRGELAELIIAEAARYKVPRTTVVIVGETKRGKSSLVNALLDAPELLPVDVDLATNVLIEVVDGPPGATVERATATETTERIEVELSALAEWATETGNERNQRAVRSLTVRHRHPLLARGLVLVDTPGVGGLDTAHAEVTLASLAVADALVFVLDASAPLTASELRFLERAADRVDTVLFALTKTDAFRGWTDILAADRSLIERYAPPFAGASMFPLSSRLRDAAVRARHEGRDEFATRADAESGYPAFVEALSRGVLDRADAVRLGNLVRLSKGILERLRAQEIARIAAAQGDSAAAGELEREQIRLRNVLEATAKWRVDLDGDLRQLGLDLDTELDYAVATLDRELERRITKASPRDLKQFDIELEQTLQALWVNVNLFVRDHLLEVVNGLRVTLDVDDVDALLELEMPERIGEMISARAGAGPDDVGAAAKLLNYYPVVFAGSGVSMVSAQLHAVGLPSLVGGPLVLASGLAMAGMFSLRHAITRRGSSVRNASRLLKTTLPQARATLSKQFARRLIDMRRGIEEHVGSRLDERRRALETLVREQQELLRSDTIARQRVHAEATARVAEIDQRLATATSLRRRLAADDSSSAGTSEPAPAYQSSTAPPS